MIEGDGKDAHGALPCCPSAPLRVLQLGAQLPPLSWAWMAWERLLSLALCLTVLSALNKAWCASCFSCSTCNSKLTLK